MRQVYILISFAIALSILLGISRAQAESEHFIDLKRVPLDGNSAQDFVPPGWKIEGQSNGDVNGDARPDLVLTLIEVKPEDTSIPPIHRAVIILVKTENGKWHRAGAADRLLCWLLMVPVSVDIQNGLIVVTQKGTGMTADSILTDRTQRFKYDAGFKRFVLVGEDFESYDSDLSDSSLIPGKKAKENVAFNPCSITTSVDYLTGAKIVTEHDKKAAPLLVTKGQVPMGKIFIEDVDFEENEQFEESERPPTSQAADQDDSESEQATNSGTSYPKGEDLVAGSSSSKERTALKRNYQKICGWVDNPTPANWSITDRTGEWEIGVQGGHQAEGDMPDYGDRPDRSKVWVETNGHYGYGCSCIEAKVDSKHRRIRAIEDAQVLPIKTCRTDSTLSQQNRKQVEVLGGCRFLK